MGHDGKPVTSLPAVEVCKLLLGGGALDVVGRKCTAAAKNRLEFEVDG